MKRIFAASAAALTALALGGIAWADGYSHCNGLCSGWYGDNIDLWAACMNGCCSAHVCIL